MKRKVLLVLFGFILGIVVSGTCVYAATLYEATEVAYDNSSSGTSNVNVQTALDELYKKVGELTGKQLKHELLVNLSGQIQNGTKVLQRDYLYVFATGVSTRGNVAQQMNFGGTAPRTDIYRNANYGSGFNGDYVKSYSLYTNPKKGQTVTYSSTWNSYVFVVGVYEE